MPTDIIMPQLGESIAEGTIVKWLIATGGRVEKDQSLLEVETDKVALEIPSPASGYLTEVLVPEGQTVPVGTLLARLNTEQTSTAVVNRVSGVIVHPATSDHHSPAVRRLAQEQGVDLSQVVGTGADGRITKKDVLDLIANRETSGEPATPQVKSPVPPPPTVQEEILPFTPMRKTIAERMVSSRHTSAHVVTFFEADMGEIAKAREGRGLTYLPFIVHAVCRALQDMPILNSSWGNQGITIKRDVHMGIAVALEDGLLVPVVRNADKKGVSLLGRETGDLA